MGTEGRADLADEINDLLALADASTALTPAEFSTVIRFFPMLAGYVTALENPAAVDTAWRSGALTPAADRSLRTLRWARSFNVSPAALLGTFDPIAGMTLVNRLRRDAGGTLPSRDVPGDVTLAALTAFAGEFAPLYLDTPPTPNGDIAPIALPVGAVHPAIEVLVDAVRHDPMLAVACGDDLFGVAFEYGPDFPLRGSHQQLVRLDELGFSLLADAATELTLTRTARTVDALTASLERVLTRLRHLLTGESHSTTAQHGLAGISLPQAVTIGELELRPVRPGDLDEDRRPGRYPTVATMPVQTVLTQPITVTAVPAPEFAPQPASPHDDDTSHPLGRLRLALLFTTIDSGYPTTVRLCWSAPPPLRWAGGHVLRPANPPRIPYGLALGPDDHLVLGQWYDRIASHHHLTLVPVIRRLLRACTDRDHDDDAIVDAVIALEALFRDDTRTELAHRVSLAAAWLLHPHDPHARRATFKVAKILYDHRSTTVHDGARKTPATAGVSVRDQAVMLTTRCLAALYRDRPDLIPDRQRGLALQLGSPTQGSDIEPTP